MAGEPITFYRIWVTIDGTKYASKEIRVIRMLLSNTVHMTGKFVFTLLGFFKKFNPAITVTSLLMAI